MPGTPPYTSPASSNPSPDSPGCQRSLHYDFGIIPGEPGVEQVHKRELRPGQAEGLRGGVMPVLDLVVDRPNRVGALAEDRAGERAGDAAAHPACLAEKEIAEDAEPAALCERRHDRRRRQRRARVLAGRFVVDD